MSIKLTTSLSIATKRQTSYSSPDSKYHSKEGCLKIVDLYFESD